MDGKIEHVLNNKSHLIFSSNGKWKEKAFTKEIYMKFLETYVLKLLRLMSSIWQEN